MDAQEIAEFTSLTLTVPTIVLAIGVIYMWGPAAWRAIKARDRNSSHGWFIIGVVVGFLGGLLDNAFWSVPWTASYFGAENVNELMSLGVYFNIFFRQSAGIVAAYCHLRAAQMTGGSRAERRVNWIISAAWALYVIGSMGLLLFSWGYE